MTTERTGTATRDAVVVARLFGATTNRAEPYDAFSSDELDALGAAGSPDVLVAVHLYKANVALQKADQVTAVQATDEAYRHLAETAPARLRWWFYHLRAEVNGVRGDHVSSFADYERALEIAGTGFGLDIELERSAANLLYWLRDDGQGQAVAAMLVRYLHHKRTNALGPNFYQIVADSLRWLGHFELSYQFRVRSMEIVTPQGGRVARDHRELARTLIALHRLEDARTHLARAKDWVPSATIEEAVDYYNVRAELCAAADDLEGARESFDLAHSLSPIARTWARSLLSVGELLLVRRDFSALAEIVDPVKPTAVSRDVRPRLFVLKAEIAAHQGDVARAARLFGVAKSLGAARIPRTETQAEILRELGPWLSVATPGSAAHSLIEARRSYRARWLRATAGDIRRSLAPAFLAADTEASADAINKVFRATIDELILVAEFLFDAAGYTDTRPQLRRSRMSSVIEEIAKRRGVTLQIMHRVGAVNDDGDEQSVNGAVERFVLGLVALIIDHASAGTTIAVEIGASIARIDTTELRQEAVAGALGDLQSLLLNTRSRHRRMPRRASFLATFDAVTSLGWSVSFMNPGERNLVVEIVGPPPRASAKDPRESSPSASMDYRVEPVITPWPDGPIGRALRRQHDRRLDGSPMDPDLLDRARASGDIDVWGCALFLHAIAAFQQGDFQTSARFVKELRGLFDTDPGLEARLKPGPAYLYNLESLLASAAGDARAKWTAAARCVIDLAPLDDTSLTFAHMVYNWTNAELARGELASAWHSVGMCDSTGTSIAGRCLVLGLHTLVLLSEGALEEAAQVAAERAELARKTEMSQRQESLEFLALTLGRLGRCEEALQAIDKLSSSRALSSPGVREALRALALFTGGRPDEAKAACIEAQNAVVSGFGAPALSVSVPVYAQLLLEEGRPDQAKAILDTFPLDQHRYFDLADRLRVQRRVEEAIGDDDAILDTIRAQVRFACRQQRFDARTLPIYDELWWTLGECARRDRQRIDEEQTAVASVVAHDLRNALGAASLALEVREMYPQRTPPSRIVAALLPIEHLAEQLDSVAQCDGTSSGPGPELIDLVSVLEMATGPAGAAVESSGGTFLVDWCLPDGITVRTHQNMLLAVIANLVGNAVKHGRKQGTVRVGATYFSAADLDGYRSAVTVTIDDDGPGMPPDQAARLDPSSPQSSASDGLGLWIVRRYAGALGIKIKVGSSRLGGALVTIEIPIGEVHDSTPDGDSGDDDPSASRTAAASRLGDGASRTSRTVEHILVVEDDERLCSLITEFLGSLGKEVVTASTATQALSLVDQYRVDLVLADVELADESSGFEVVNGVHRIGLAPSIVVMSGQSAQQIRALCTEQIRGAFQVLPKPFTLSALAEVVGSSPGTGSV